MVVYANSMKFSYMFIDENDTSQLYSYKMFSGAMAGGIATVCT